MRAFCLLMIVVMAAVMAGCASTKPLQDRITAQEQIISKLREDNAQFQKNYYQIKDILDTESADKDRKMLELKRELDKSQNLKTQKERELGDDLKVVKLQFEAFRGEAGEQQKAAEANAERLRQQIGELTAERDASLKKLADLDAQYRVQQQRLDEITKETAELRVNLKAVQGQAENLTKERAELQKSLQAEKSSRADVESKLAAAQKAQSDTESRLAATEADLKKAQTESSRLKSESAAAQTQLSKAKRDLEQAAAERKKAESTATASSRATPSDPADDPQLKAVAEKIRPTVAGIEGANVRVDSRGLRIILPSDRIFQEKSIILATRATPALDQIGEALALISDRPVRIEGHTDSQPVQDLPFADNWGLGYARADRVREYLMRSGKLGSKNVTALSRADQDPLGTSAAANRRVEIVVGAR